jgi:phage gp29-like protein
MKLTQWIVNGLRGARVTRRPSAGRLLQPRAADTVRAYPSAGLTPSRLTTILREADAGSLGRAMQLFEEMEEKDAHLHAVASKRRLALTGLPWRVVSAAEINARVDRSAADAAAAYCQETFEGIEAFDEGLQHLGLAIGRNIAVAELVWGLRDGSVSLLDIVPVDFQRITFDDLDRPRILTDDEPVHGIELPANKFIAHTPHSVSGHPARGGLFRATALVFLAKNLALKDWMIFAEVFGMPVRIARYDPSATPEEKREMVEMLESLGSYAMGVFSRAIELEFVEAGQGKAPPPYEKLVDFLNREMSKAWLGQTLTTEMPGLGGSVAATIVHDQVRKDLRADDIRKEGRTLRRDLLAPLARLKFGPDVPVPYFRRGVDGPRDVEELLDAAVNRLGARVPARWAHEALGVPRAAEGEAVLGGRQQASGYRLQGSGGNGVGAPPQV